MRAMQLLALLVSISLCRGVDVDEYRFSWQPDGSTFELKLLAGEEQLANFTAKPFQNLTTLGRGGNNEHPLIPILLEEAAGGRCDACIVLVRQLWALTARLIAESGAVKQSTDQSTDYTIKLDLENAAIRRQYGELCFSEEYRHFAPHVIKGCVELMNMHGQSIVDRISNTMKKSLADYVELPTSVCTHLLGVCPALPRPEPKVSECAACGMLVNELHFRLRSDGRAGKVVSSDPMAISKKKSRVTPFMSRSHVLSRMDALCDNLQLGMMLTAAEAGPLTEMCEEFVEEYQEALAAEFVSHQGKASWRDPVKALCVPEKCSPKDFQEMETTLASRWTGKVTPPDQVIPIYQDVFEAITQWTPKDLKLISERTKSKVKHAKRETKERSPDMELDDESHERLEKMAANGLLSQSQFNALMAKFYDHEEVLMRVFKYEGRKGDEHLAERLKLIVPAREEL